MAFKTMHSIQTYLFTTLPATCPLCGARSDIVSEERQAEGLVQQHQCMDERCGFEFVMEEE